MFSDMHYLLHFSVKGVVLCETGPVLINWAFGRLECTMLHTQTYNEGTKLSFIGPDVLSSQAEILACFGGVLHRVE